MTKQFPTSSSRDPRPPPTRGRSTTRLYDLVETRVRRLLVDNPIARDVPRHPHRGPPPRRPEPRRRARPRSPRTGRTSRRSRRSTTPGSRRRRGSSATSRSTTSASPCSTPTRSGAGSGDRPRPASSATRCSCCSPAARRRSRSGSSGSPTGSRPRRRSSSRRRPARPARRSRSGSGPRRATPPTCRRLFAEVRAARGRRPRRLRRWPTSTGRSRAPSAALEAYGGWVPETLDDGTDDWPLGRGALRRARPAAGVRGPRRRRDPRRSDCEQLAGEPRGPRARRRARSTPTPTCRASSTASSPTARPTFDEALDGYRDVMRRARAYLIEHDLVTIPDDEPIEVLADARVPALASCRSPPTSRPRRFDADDRGPVHRHAGRRRRPQRDARALLGGDLEHEHPRGLPGPPPPARRRRPPPVADPDAHRRPRVRRGLGHVLRAADARGGLRRRAGVPGRHVHRRRSGGRAGSSSTSGCTAAS